MTLSTVDAAPESPIDLMESVNKAFAGSLYAFLLRYARGRHQVAEDMLQETMLRVWRGIESLPEPIDSRRRWLFSIARHVAIDADRARRVRPSEWGGLDLNHLAAESGSQDRVLNVHAVRVALAKLTPAHRTVLVELYYGDRTLAEAAERLGIPEGTVKSRSHHALRALRASLGPDA